MSFCGCLCSKRVGWCARVHVSDAHVFAPVQVFTQQAAERYRSRKYCGSFCKWLGKMNMNSLWL